MERTFSLLRSMVKRCFFDFHQLMEQRVEAFPVPMDDFQKTVGLIKFPAQILLLAWGKGLQGLQQLMAEG